MYSVLSEALIASSYLIFIAIVIVISAITDCSKKKELIVEPTQPSLRDNSEIGVFNRDGETDIEMPSHSHKFKETGENKESDGRKLSEVKKLDDKEKKKELESNPNSKESENRHSAKEKHSRKDEPSAKNDNRGGESEGKDQESAKQKQLSDIKGSNRENKEEPAEKRKSWKSEKHRSDKQNFNQSEQVVADDGQKKEENERKE